MKPRPEGERTIRDEFRRALDERSPSEERARADLERIVERTRRRPSTLRRIGPPVAAAAAIAAAAAAFVLTRPPDPPRAPTAPVASAPPAPPDRTIRIYLKETDEPESAALSITLSIPGEPRP